MTVGLYKRQRKFIKEIKTEHLRTYWWEWDYFHNRDIDEKWDKFLEEVKQDQQDRLIGLPYKVDIIWVNKITKNLMEHNRALMRWLESEVGEGNYDFIVSDEEALTSVYFKDKRKAFMFKLKWA